MRRATFQIAEIKRK